MSVDLGMIRDYLTPDFDEAVIEVTLRKMRGRDPKNPKGYALHIANEIADEFEKTGENEPSAQPKADCPDCYGHGWVLIDRDSPEARKVKTARFKGRLTPEGWTDKDGNKMHFSPISQEVKSSDYELVTVVEDTARHCACWA